MPGLRDQAVVKNPANSGPFSTATGFGEADYSHAMRKASFDRSLDEVGREEGKRD
jgi:hypothetical protein